MRGYHVTTPKKLERYVRTGCILEPVRFWVYLASAKAWAKRTGRTVILQFDVEKSYPLPDHKPRGHARWTDQHIREWRQICQNPTTLDNASD